MRYSFKDVMCSMIGPGGVAILGNGSGAGEGGIKITPTGDKSTMMTGADGESVHSLIAGEPSTVEIELLKTSPMNAILSMMYELQTSSSAFHGQNVITLAHIVQGDFIGLRQVAFKKRPDLAYGKEAGVNVWTFDAGQTEIRLGTGTPEL